jgi:hypothetical protein
VKIQKLTKMVALWAAAGLQGLVWWLEVTLVRSRSVQRLETRGKAGNFGSISIVICCCGLHDYASTMLLEGLCLVNVPGPFFEHL